MYTCIHIYIYTHTHVYVCMCMCIYIYIYTYHSPRPQWKASDQEDEKMIAQEESSMNRKVVQPNKKA